MKIFSLFFLLLFFFACTQQQNDSEVILAASPEQTLDLDGEILPIQELIPMSICRLDTFLVILNMEEEKIVRVYHADTYRFLGAFLEKGRGSDEVITCRKIWAAPWKGKMRLWLQAPLNFVGVVDLESSLKTGKPCWKQQYKLGRYVKSDHLYRSVFPLNDSVFWISCAEEPSWLYPEGTLKKNPDGSYTVISEKGMQSFPPKNLDWLEFNYASSQAQDTIWYTSYTDLQYFDRIFSTEEAMSPDQHKIVVAFRLMNQMLFFDRKKLTSKWLTTSTELPLPHTTDGQHYSGVCCTDKTVLAFRAFPLHPDGRKRERNISVFDWNGKFKYLLNIEHPLKAPFFDAEKGFLYATDDEDRIRKYAVGEFL